MKRIMIIIHLLILFNTTLNQQNSSMQGLIVVGNKTGLETINKKQLKGIFRGSQTIWPTNEQVIVVMPSIKADFADDFATSVLQMSQSAIHKYWLELVFQGRAHTPVFLNSNSEILEFIKTTPGAIGVVKMQEREIPKGLIISISNR
jgi:ABC-type phosphate transport system substrate-binding protein